MPEVTGEANADSRLDGEEGDLAQKQLRWDSREAEDGRETEVGSSEAGCEA